jgi:hypothetical protein
MNQCDQINAMLATQRALQSQLTDEVQEKEVALGVATRRLREAADNHLLKMGDLNTSKAKLKLANEVIEQLSMMRAGLMC